MTTESCQNDFNFHTKLLIWQGLLPTKTRASTSGENFRYFYPRVLLMYSLYNLLIAHPVDMYLNWGDRNNLAENIANMFLFAMLIINIITFLRHGEWFAAWTDLLKDLNHPNKMTEEYDRIAEWTNWICRFVYVTFLKAILWIGLINITLFYSAGLLGFQKKRKLFFSCWYPFDSTRFPGFDIAMFLQALSLAYFLIIGSMDLFAMVNHLRMNVQLKILAYKFEHLRETANQNVKLKAATEEGSYEIIRVRYRRYETLGARGKRISKKRVGNEQIKIQEEMNSLLIHYVRQHVILTRTIKEFYSVIDWRYFFQIICNLLSIGVLGLAISNYPVWDVKSIAYVTVLAMNYIQWFLYCLIPEETVQMGSQISEAVYNSDWLTASPKLRKKLLIVMTFANQPIVAQILGFIPLTLDLFSSVNKRAYSFFTVFDSI